MMLLKEITHDIYIDLQSWSTLQQNVDTPLTVEAFNGVFDAFATIFIAYFSVSILGTVSIILVSINRTIASKPI